MKIQNTIDTLLQNCPWLIVRNHMQYQSKNIGDLGELIKSKDSFVLSLLHVDIALARLVDHVVQVGC